MIKTLYNSLRAILLLVICLSLPFGLNQPVQAAPPPCTWEGDTSNDWFTPENWDYGYVPTEVDTVVIPSEAARQPTIATMRSVTVSSIDIKSGATLTILSGSAVNAATWTVDGALTANTGDSLIHINIPGGGVINVGSTGTVTKLGTGNLFFYASLNNDGTMLFTEHGTYDGGVGLKRGGEHTGIFQGEYLFLGDNDTASGQVFTFNSDSDIRVNQFHAKGGTVNILGSFSPPNNTGTNLFVQPYSGTSVVWFKPGASILKMPENFSIDNGGKLILESQSYNYTMPKLRLEYGGELHNLGNLYISTQFLWWAGKITGSGTTTIVNGAVFTMGTSAYDQNDFTLDTQILINNSTANWNKRNLTFSNSAEFVNNGTFNANATTTMSGGETERFTNHGSLVKNTAGTTTTINIPFTNDGTVNVVAGKLVFKLNDSTLDPGDTLNLGSGESLIGSGTLAADLVNGGTVSPGESPGRITVVGNYTQLGTGFLIIELGGTTAGKGYDQLVVTGTAPLEGTATMHGTLTVSILPGFTPQVGDTFFIIDHVTGTGTFDTVSLPSLVGNLKMEINFSDEGVTLTVVEGDTFSIYLPLIVK